MGEIAHAEEADVELAVEAAERAQPAWAALASSQRGAILGKWANLIREHAVQLAEVGLDSERAAMELTEFLGRCVGHGPTNISAS